MLAKDIMTPCAVFCTRHTSLRVAAQLMLENNCPCLPVMEDHNSSGAIIAVLSERDLICRVVTEGLDPMMSTVWLAMNMPAEIVHDDATLDECNLRLRHRQIKHLVVVDRQDALCGIITQGDITRQRAPVSTDDWSPAISSPAARTRSGRLVATRSSSNQLQAVRSTNTYLPGSEPGDSRPGI